MAYRSAAKSCWRAASPRDGIGEGQEFRVALERLTLAGEHATGQARAGLGRRSSWSQTSAKLRRVAAAGGLQATSAGGLVVLPSRSVEGRVGVASMD